MDAFLLELLNQTLAHPLLDLIMSALTLLTPALLPIVAAAFVMQGDRRAAGALLATLAVALFVTLVFYGLGLRPRPPRIMDVRIVLPPPALPSFPSGHAMLGFSAAMLVGLVRGKRSWLLIALLLAAAVGVSRIYLGHHFPSDVFAGMVMGTALGAAGYGFLYLDERIMVRLRWLLWPQIGLVVMVTLMAYLGILPWRLLAWPHADKVMHFLLFGAIAFWLNLWLRGNTWSLGGRWIVPVAIVLPLLIAVSEELFQATSPQRTASLVDLGADLLGLLFFWGLSAVLLRRGALTVGASKTVGTVKPSMEF